LENPDKPSAGVRIPVVISITTTDKATISERIFPQIKKNIATIIIAKTIIMFVSIK
jgi:hypothetical protein